MSTPVPMGPGGTPAPVPPGPGGPVAPPSAAPGAELAAQHRPTVTVGTYDSYADAQRAVDYLSDNKFPVEHASIVGTDLKLVERITGRLTTGRAAVAGLASGAWFGLFIGLIIGIFTTNVSWLGIILATVLIGAVWGAVFGALAHAATGGRRDFSSRSMLQASQYAVTVDADQADEARHMLVQLNWRASGAM